MKNFIHTLFMLTTLVLPGCKWFACDCTHDHNAAHSHAATPPTTPAPTQPPVEAFTVTKIGSTQDFEEKVIAATKPVLVDFNAKWCGPCQSMKPIFAELAQELGSKYVFAEVDVDEANDVADKYNIQGIPTFTFFKDGKEVINANDRILGAVNKETLKAALEKYLG